MDWYWIALIVIGIANVYMLVALVMVAYFFDDMIPSVNIVLSLNWPISFPVWVFILFMAAMFSKEK